MKRKPSDLLPATGFIRAAQFIPHIVPVSKTALWRMVQSKTFPAPIKLPVRITAWRVEDVREWVDAQGARGEPV